MSKFHSPSNLEIDGHILILLTYNSSNVCVWVCLFVCVKAQSFVEMSNKIGISSKWIDRFFFSFWCYHHHTAMNDTNSKNEFHLVAQCYCRCRSFVFSACNVDLINIKVTQTTTISNKMMTATNRNIMNLCMCVCPMPIVYVHHSTWPECVNSFWMERQCVFGLKLWQCVKQSV